MELLLTTTLTCEKINQTVIITVKLIVYFETFACCSTRKRQVPLIFKQTSHLDLPHFSEPAVLYKG